MKKQNKEFGIKPIPQLIILKTEVGFRTRLWFLLTNIFRYLMKGEIRI